MKKSLAIILIVLLVVTCSVDLSFGTDADRASINVSVEATGTEAFTISEGVTARVISNSREATVDALRITNKTEDYTVRITNIQAKGVGEWKTASSTAVDAATDDSKLVYLAVWDDGIAHNLTGVRGYNVTDGAVTPEDGYRDFQLSGKLSGQFTPSDEDGIEVAKLVVTISIECMIDGFSVGYLQGVQWSTGTDKEIAAVVHALDKGIEGFTVKELMENNGFMIGASRDVTITSSSGKYSTAKLVIWDANVDDTRAAANYKLTTQKGDTLGVDYDYIDARKKTASFIIGIENLSITGTMDIVNYKGSWGGISGRTTVNDIYGTLPDSIQDIFKSFETRTAIRGSDELESVSDNLALPAPKEVSKYADEEDSTAIEANTLIQFKYFHYFSPLMYVNGNLSSWWLRSPHAYSYTHDYDFCYIYCHLLSTNYPDWDVDGQACNNTAAFVPFGCI